MPRYASIISCSPAVTIGSSVRGPATAARVTASGAVERVPLQAVCPGDRLAVARGAVIPMEGVLCGESAFVDESLITGESRAVSKRAGETLLGGSVNAGHPIQVTAAAGAADSRLAGLVSLLRRAQTRRPPVMRAADRGTP